MCSFGPPCYIHEESAYILAEHAGRGSGTYVCVSGDEFSHVARRVLVELLVLAKDEDGDIDRAEDGELMRLLEETTLALKERAIVVDQLVSRRAADVGSMHLDDVG